MFVKIREVVFKTILQDIKNFKIKTEYFYKNVLKQPQKSGTIKGGTIKSRGGMQDNA